MAKIEKLIRVVRTEEIKARHFEMGRQLKRYEPVVHNIILVDIEAI